MAANAAESFRKDLLSVMNPWFLVQFAGSVYGFSLVIPIPGSSFRVTFPSITSIPL
jgi:hypothetical protein